MTNIMQEDLPGAPTVAGMEAIMEYNGALISNGSIELYARNIKIDYLPQVQLVPFFYNIDEKGNKLEDNNVIITKQIVRAQRWNPKK